MVVVVVNPKLNKEGANKISGGSSMKVKCQKCGYEWDTSSSMNKVTCPSCGYKTPKQPGTPNSIERGIQTQPSKEKDQREVKLLNTKWAGVIALIIAVAVGAYAGSVYLTGGETEGGTGGEETTPGVAKISAKAAPGTVFAANPADSGIENIYILANGSGYVLDNEIENGTNPASSSDFLGVIESDGDVAEIPYDTSFDIVVAVRAENQNNSTGETEIAYVTKENLKIEWQVPGPDITLNGGAWDNSADTEENEFAEGLQATADHYVRVNFQDPLWTNLTLNADENMTINVDYWLYR